MKNDPHIVINTELSTAWIQARAFIRRHWKAMLTVWLLTNLLSSIAYVVLYPPWGSGGPGEGADSFRYSIYVVTTALIGAAGFVFVVHLARLAAVGQQRSDYGSVLDESVHRLARYIATSLLCFVRVILWGLMAVPLLMLFSLLGIGAQSSVLATVLFSAPVMLLMALAFVRFGWGLYFTVINGDSPLWAMHHGQSMYLNNRRKTWALALIVFLVPGFLPIADVYNIGGLGEYVHPASYVASAWTYVASVFATMVLTRAVAAAESADAESAVLPQE